MLAAAILIATILGGGLLIVLALRALDNPDHFHDIWHDDDDDL